MVRIAGSDAGWIFGLPGVVLVSHHAPSRLAIFSDDELRWLRSGLVFDESYGGESVALRDEIAVEWVRRGFEAHVY